MFVVEVWRAVAGSFLQFGFSSQGTKVRTERIYCPLLDAEGPYGRLTLSRIVTYPSAITDLLPYRRISNQSGVLNPLQNALHSPLSSETTTSRSPKDFDTAL